MEGPAPETSVQTPAPELDVTSVAELCCTMQATAVALQQQAEELQLVACKLLAHPVLQAVPQGQLLEPNFQSSSFPTRPVQANAWAVVPSSMSLPSQPNHHSSSSQGRPANTWAVVPSPRASPNPIGSTVAPAPCTSSKHNQGGLGGRAAAARAAADGAIVEAGSVGAVLSMQLDKTSSVEVGEDGSERESRRTEACLHRCGDLLQVWAWGLGQQTNKCAIKLTVLLVKMSAAVPWAGQCAVSSQVYAILVALACSASLSIFAFRSVTSGAEEQQCHLHVDVVLAASALLSLLASGGPFRHWRLAASHVVVATQLQEDKSLNDWARASRKGLAKTLGLWCLSVGCRVAFCWDELMTGRQLPVLQLIAIVITTFVLLGQIIMVKLLATGLTSIVDIFVEQMLKGQPVQWGRARWQVTSAMIRTVNQKMHLGLLVLQSTVVLFVAVAAFELISARVTLRDQALKMLSGGLVALLLALGFAQVAQVARCCNKAPQLLSNLHFEDDKEDQQFHRLVNIVAQAEAGFKILGEQVTPGLLLRGSYVIVAGVTFLVVNVVLRFQSD